MNFDIVNNTQRVLKLAKTLFSKLIWDNVKAFSNFQITSKSSLKIAIIRGAGRYLGLVRSSAAIRNEGA